MSQSVNSRIVEKKVMQLFWKIFIVFIVLVAVSAILPSPFNQIAMIVGFASFGFCFGMLGTISVMQELESKPKPSS